MKLRCATFNTLADAYTGYGDYSHVNPELLVKGARMSATLRLIDELQADVIGLQEAEAPLVEALNETDEWQSFWSPKTHNKPDGCLLLVKRGIDVEDFNTHPYSDDSSHVMQTIRIGRTVFTNSHIKWAPDDDPNHAGIYQTAELLEELGPDQPALIFADCNDRPNGPVRKLVEHAGFINISGDEPTAFVNQETAALDLLAIRGVPAKRVETHYRPTGIPNEECPSDHIPIMAIVETE